MTQLLMPKATAVWLVDNTSLTFQQISDFCKLHPLEVKAIADGEAAHLWDASLGGGEGRRYQLMNIPEICQLIEDGVITAAELKETLLGAIDVVQLVGAGPRQH